MHTMALECFKISYKLSPTVSKTTTYGKNSFKCLAAVLWNDLPDDIRGGGGPVLINLKTFHNFKYYRGRGSGGSAPINHCHFM